MSEALSPPATKPSPAQARLWIVATPIGNLDDLTLRALATLKRADGILAEDTRHTRKLCTHHGIATRLHSLHAHSSDQVVTRYLSWLEQGKLLALVTDAGTPMISDPGAALARAARDAGIGVTALPGASAVTAALCVAGIAFDDFRFVGFLPRSGARRALALEAIIDAPETTVFFESPKRILATLTDLMRAAGPSRRVAVCRELTKLHEEVVCDALANVVERLRDGVQGEITVVVERSQQAPSTPSTGELDQIITTRLAAGESARDITRSLSTQFGLSRRALYKRVVELAGGKDG